MWVKDQLQLGGELWKDIKADESGWLIDREANQRCIIITLIKRDAGHLNADGNEHVWNVHENI